MRFVRLKAKLDGTGSAGSAPTAQAPLTSRPAGAKKAIIKNKAKVASKRKADSVDSSTSSDDVFSQGPPQVDGADDNNLMTPRRPTRTNKKPKYDAKAIFDEKDADSSSLTSSDADYVCKVKDGEDEEDEEDSYLETEDDLMPATKRHKTTTVSAARAPSSSMSESYITLRTSYKKSPVKKRPSSSRKVDQKRGVQTMASVASRVKSNARIASSDRPLPSIEFSPPLLPSKASVTDASLGDADVESEIDIGSLRPGTVITFPPRRASQESTSMQNVSVPRSESSSSLGSSQSFLTSSEADLASQTRHGQGHAGELRPEDSVSNISKRQANVSPPATPTSTRNSASMISPISTGSRAEQFS